MLTTPILAAPNSFMYNYIICQQSALVCVCLCVWIKTLLPVYPSTRRYMQSQFWEIIYKITWHTPDFSSVTPLMKSKQDLKQNKDKHQQRGNVANVHQVWSFIHILAIFLSTELLLSEFVVIILSVVCIWKCSITENKCKQWVV